MNNYNNMNYFIPNEYMMNDINGMQEYVNFLNSGMGLQKNGQQIQDKMNNQKLFNKLKKQAGDNMNFNVSDYQQEANSASMYDPYNGFIRGNMFSDLYNTYKIARPYDVKPANEQAELLTNIDAYCFAAHDLNLYLDNNPNDREMIKLFKDYSDKANGFIKEYEQKYGPIFVDASNGYSWSWNESPWPWENK